MSDYNPIDELERMRQKRLAQSSVEPKGSQPKTESGSGGGKMPPNKAAAGFSGEWGSYRAGQKLPCRILAREPGGYSVLLVGESRSGFLPTTRQLEIGEELDLQFVCIHGDRILLL
ncbi:MAG TPA: hypothetical protein V6C72_13425 [Chroococcales cyanobacterium]